MNFFNRYEKNTISNESFKEPVKREPLEELHYQLDNISTEDFKDFVNYLGVKYAALSIAIKDAFDVLTTWNNEPMNRLHMREFQVIMNKLDYLELKNLEVPQPISFNGTLLNYLEDSKKRFEFTANFSKNILIPAIKRFGHYLTNPDERSDRRGFVKGVEFSNREEMIRDNASWFNYNQRSATALFGTLYHSNTEFVKCLAVTDQYKTLIESHAKASVISKQVDELKNVILALMERLGKDEIKPSQEFIDMLSQDVKDIARWVEFYSLMMAMLMDVNSCLSQTEELLKKQF